MKDLLVEHTVICPSCWEPHSTTIDLTTEERSFIEDCYVCCNPMTICFEIDIDAAKLANITVESC